MNVCVRRLIHKSLISHVKVSNLNRGMVTCHSQGGVKNSLVPFLSHKDKEMKCVDISDKVNDLSMRMSSVRLTIIDPVVDPKGEIRIPISVIIKDINLPKLNNTEMIDPVENVIEKKAHRMLRIRRRKIKRHKWKKLQKKMKYVFAKIRKKREAKKEAIFQAELNAIVSEGVSFSPDKELRRKVEILSWEKPINKVRGRLCPKWVVDEYLEEQRLKKILDQRIATCLKKMQ